MYNKRDKKQEIYRFYSSYPLVEKGKREEKRMKKINTCAASLHLRKPLPINFLLLPTCNRYSY